MSNIGEQIVKYRARNGLSQKKFAEMTGISVPTVKLLESGEKNVRKTTMVKIMDVLYPNRKEG